MANQLHADHADASGAYAQRFEVIQELVLKGLLLEIPVEYSIQVPDEHVTEVMTVPPQAEQFDMRNGHADHVDDTGAYRQAYDAKYGTAHSTNTQTNAGDSWKGFLQQIIAEERRKLKV